MVKVVRTSALRPSTKAVYELGKSLLEDSVGVGREFAKFMISVSTGAIPTYLALIGLLGIDSASTLAWFLAPGLFGLAMIIFVFAFLPRMDDLDIESVESIQLTRTRLITNRNRKLVLGMIVFLLGIAAAAFQIVGNAGAQPSPSHGYRFEWMEVPRNVSAEAVDERLADFRRRIGTGKPGRTVAFRELPLQDSTLVIAIIEDTGVAGDAR